MERYKKRLAQLVQPGMRLLHGGCGWDKSDVSRPFRSICQVVGVDLDPRVATRFHSEFHLASLTSMPFTAQSFDLIFLEYVLEHVIDPSTVFREMARVLKPGGRILALTPNLYSYKSLAAYGTPHAFHLVMGRVRYGRGHEADMYPTMYRCNTTRALIRLAQQSDLHLSSLDFITNGPTWFEKCPGVFAVFHHVHRALEHWPVLQRLRCAMLIELHKRSTP